MKLLLLYLCCGKHPLGRSFIDLQFCTSCVAFRSDCAPLKTGELSLNWVHRPATGRSFSPNRRRAQQMMSRIGQEPTTLERQSSPMARDGIASSACALVRHRCKPCRRSNKQLVRHLQPRATPDEAPERTGCSLGPRLLPSRGKSLHQATRFGSDRWRGRIGTGTRMNSGCGRQTSIAHTKGSVEWSTQFLRFVLCSLNRQCGKSTEVSVSIICRMWCRF